MSKPKKHHRKWNDADTAYIFTLYEKGYNFQEIGEKVGRTYKAVSQRYHAVKNARLMEKRLLLASKDEPTPAPKPSNSEIEFPKTDNTQALATSGRKPPEHKPFARITRKDGTTIDFFE